MDNSVEDIEHISIYLKHPENLEERIGEVTLYNPLFAKKKWNKASLPISARKWSFSSNLNWIRKIVLNIQVVAFKRFSKLAPVERKTREAKFKTCLALLLTQENLRELFFRGEEQSKHFFNAIQKAAKAFGIKDFAMPASCTNLTPLQISRELTWMEGKGGSLIDDLPELNLQMALLNQKERDELLFTILNSLKRPPITSTVELCKKGSDTLCSIISKTTFYKYHVQKIEGETQKIRYLMAKDEATSSIKTMANMKPGAKGTANQRIVYMQRGECEPEFLGCYCGELTTKHHVLEQILCIFNGKEEAESHYLLNYTPQDKQIKDCGILLHSLFSWNEMEKITRQYYSVRSLNGAILKRITHDGAEHFYRLNLYYYNTPFNLLGKIPAMEETQGVMQDLNDETLILLAFKGLLNLKDLVQDKGNKEKVFFILSQLAPIEKKVRILRAPVTIKEEDVTDELLKSNNRMIDLIDSFRTYRKKWIQILNELHSEQGEAKDIIAILTALFSKKKGGHTLTGADESIFLSLLAQKLDLIKSTNCQQSTDRTAGVVASEKAQFVFTTSLGSSFIPGQSPETHEEIFKILYSLYLIWEEPEITSGLSSGYMGELFFRHSIKKTSETSRYLIDWIKEKPEHYLGLSSH